MQGPDTTGPSSGRVLLADDGADNQLLVGLFLRRAGFHVEVAADGQTAVERTLTAWRAGQPFDVVLMDVEMPVLDGLSATRALRRAGYPGLVVALTGYNTADDRAQCLAAGCDDHLGKPVLRAPLLESMSGWLQRVRAAT